MEAIAIAAVHHHGNHGAAHHVGHSQVPHHEDHGRLKDGWASVAPGHDAAPLVAIDEGEPEAHVSPEEGWLHPHLPGKLTRSGSVGNPSSTSSANFVNPEDDVTRVGVKQSIYTQWIQSEVAKEEQCLELPLTMLLLFSFSVMALVHISQTTISIVEDAIVADIVENANFAWAHNFGHKGIHDVNSFADFWSWTRLGLIPLLTMPWGYSEELQSAVPQLPGFPHYNVSDLPSQRVFSGHQMPVPVRNDYLRYNRIIGGFRFSQSVAEADYGLCSFPGERDVFKRWFGKPCTGLTSEELPPDLVAAEELVSPQRIEWFVSEVEDFDTLVMRAVDMEDGCTSAEVQNRTCLCSHCQQTMHPWLDELTMRVEISFLVYNAQYGLYSLAGCNFWFNRAGQIHKIINVRSSWVGMLQRDTWELAIMLVADSVWIITCMYVFVSEAIQIAGMVRKARAKPWYITIMEDYFGFWNAIDWVSIAIACVIVMWYCLLSYHTMLVNEALADYAVSSGRGNREEILSKTKDFYGVTDGMYAAEWNFRFSLGIYPLVLMLRFFKSFTAQPRLAIVTETFVVAQNDMIHFFIVFGSVYFCMAVNAVLFFGQELPGFATLGRSLHTCFRVTLGDWDWEELQQIGLLKGFMWFFIFVFVVDMILLNMLLAIFMEAYIVVTTSAKHAQSLFAQCEQLVRRNKENRQGLRKRLNEILAAFQNQSVEEGGDEDECFTNDRIIFPSDVQDLVPGITHVQARRTLRSSMVEYQRLNDDPFSVKMLQDILEPMKARADDGVVCSDWVKQKLNSYAALDDAAGGRPKRRRSDMGVFSVTDPEAEEEEDFASSDEASEQHHGEGQHTEKIRTGLVEGLIAVRLLAQDQAEELSSGAGTVITEEMERVRRRQKEQVTAMEQMQASMEGLRSLVYKLHKTTGDISRLASASMPAPAQDGVAAYGAAGAKTGGNRPSPSFR